MQVSYEKAKLNAARKIYNYSKANTTEIDLALEAYFPLYEPCQKLAVLMICGLVSKQNVRFTGKVCSFMGAVAKALEE